MYFLTPFESFQQSVFSKLFCARQCDFLHINSFEYEEQDYVNYWISCAELRFSWIYVYLKATVVGTEHLVQFQMGLEAQEADNPTTTDFRKGDTTTLLVITLY